MKSLSYVSLTFYNKFVRFYLFILFSYMPYFYYVYVHQLKSLIDLYSFIKITHESITREQLQCIILQDYFLSLNSC